MYADGTKPIDILDLDDAIKTFREYDDARMNGSDPLFWGIHHRGKHIMFVYAVMTFLDEKIKS